MKEKIKAATPLFVIAGLFLALLAGSVAYRAAAERAASTPAAVTATTATQPGADGLAKGGHAMEWAVMLYAVGEVAGLVGMGICHIRRSHRQAPASEKRGPARQEALLFYNEVFAHKVPAVQAR